MGKRNAILVVDDVEVNRSILREVLQDEFEVLEAEDGKQALDILEKQGEKIRVVLLDIVMPNVNGFEVLEHMVSYRLLENIPVILITGDTALETEQRAYDMGVSDIINKPFEPYIVLRRVENISDLYNYKQHLEAMTKEFKEKIMRLEEENKSLNAELQEIKQNKR